MWVDLSKENVMPGLRLCDELSLTVEGPNADAELRKRVAMLDAWSREATGRVAKVAREKQAEIMEGMETRIQDVKETTALIEPLAESVVKAIEAGTAVTKDAAEKSIVARAAASPLSRFGESFSPPRCCVVWGAWR